MAEDGKCSTSSRIVALRQLLNAGSRLRALLLYDMDDEPRPRVVREGELIKTDGPLDMFVPTDEDEEHLGHTTVKYGEWKLAMMELWDACMTARPLCGGMKAADDVFLLHMQVKGKNEDTWSVEDRYPNSRWDDAGVGLRLPYWVVEVRGALDYIEEEIKRLEAEENLEKRKTLPPLTDLQKAVFDLIKELPKGKGMTGKEILSKLRGGEYELSQGTLTKHIIPILKKRGVTNLRGVGYYHDPQDPD